MQKKCNSCLNIKYINEFRKMKHDDSPVGFYHHSVCIICENEYSRKYGSSNRTRRNERLKRWRKQNPEKAHALDKRKNEKRRRK